MIKIKKIALLVTVVASVFLGCGKKEGQSSNSSGVDVGVAMPTKSSQRWIDDGNNVVKTLTELGYTSNLQYAEDVVENQISQIENMMTRGVKVLIIASIDGNALTDVTKKAADQGIKIISYDRLITNTPYIEYYATFDNFKVGVLEGQYIENALGLKTNPGPFTIELFGGSPDDNNAYFFYDGAMSILEPYIKSGKLIVRSNQMGMDKVATLRWDGSLAQSRMDNLLGTFYTDGKLDAVLSPYDGISLGVVSSLKSMGFGSGDKKMPIITGQDAQIAAIKSIIAGEQTQTVLKDTSKLAKVAGNMVDSIMKGKEPEINDRTTYNNGVKIVPSYLLEPISVDKNNWKEAIIDSGYYTEDQIKN
ncbi:MAG: multiple monosaccharide ABC transporter substrate-binding protein [Cetobacterium sp.]|uniref:multiple monosaccharide ABC transporter substrate-binding protein n=1 Tax=unclassified Cetobacterium TaxID=2630983 RepID=UPI0009DFCB98|nr:MULTISPECIES: multiple monosaccharide ABC transporter substrate-binding protein [unclassified Cetobacterium]